MTTVKSGILFKIATNQPIFVLAIFWLTLIVSGNIAHIWLSELFSLLIGAIFAALSLLPASEFAAWAHRITFSGLYKL